MSRPQVLIVDDEDDIRDLISRSLAREGFEVTGAEHGGIALELMAKKQFDAVVLDVRMPVMDGYETLRRIRADPKLMQIPVLILSAHHDRRDLLQGLALGADEYLAKPMEPWELKARIASLIKISELRRQVADLEREKQAALRRMCGQICLRMLNPAGEIDGFLQLQASGHPRESDRALATDLAGQSAQMLRLLRTMAEYAQVAPSPIEMVDVGDVLELARAGVGAELDPARWSCRVSLARGLPRVPGRKFELSLAFMEVLAHAARTMEEGGVVEVHAQSAGSGVTVEVREPHGVITAEQLVAPFSADQPPGLPLARSIFEDHSGRMEIAAAALVVHLPAQAA